MRRVFSLLVGFVVVVALAGCSSAGSVGPTPSGTLSPSVVVSPSPSPAPDMDALYAEAERVLRRSFELEDRYMQAGDFDEYPPELFEVLADPYLSQSQAVFQMMKESGYRAAEGTVAVFTVKPLPGVSRSGSEVALAVCLDTRASPLVDANGNVVSEGALFNPSYYFRHLNGKLMLFLSDAGEEVEKC